MGNEEANELICMTHGHELRWEKWWWEGERGRKGTENK